ncbi:MAG: hypothetical protein JSV93_01385 [Candidatus Omnitrophota bacterium]|nr:MAG: hypothetical protein JSV93_01385 [Candidatus Omnitrophota bacterium]
MKKIALKIITIVVLAGFVANLSGCAALKRKFTRKKKEKPKTPLYQVRKYDIKPTLGLYEKHYIFWANWHKKLVDELGKNHKSDLRSIREMINNLEHMAALVVPEKAEYFAPHIDTLSKTEVIIEKRNMTKINKTRIKRILEREYRLVKRKFSPSRIEGYIRKKWK